MGWPPRACLLSRSSRRKVGVLRPKFLYARSTTRFISSIFSPCSRFFSPSLEVHGKNDSKVCGSTSMTLTDEPGIPRQSSRLILLGVCIGQIIVGLDQRAITVALPTLATTFHAAFTTIQWTILVYDLVLIGLIITMGRLGDLFGRRRFYSLGFVIFVIASALCGLSQTTGQLIFFRAVQALGGS
ncbi:MFS transporter, partial [bacterium]